MPVLEAQPPSAAHSTTIPKFRILIAPALKILAATNGGGQAAEPVYSKLVY
jgi:hypothetical protein